MESWNLWSYGPVVLGTWQWINVSFILPNFSPLTSINCPLQILYVFCWVLGSGIRKQLQRTTHFSPAEQSEGDESPLCLSPLPTAQDLGGLFRLNASLQMARAGWSEPHSDLYSTSNPAASHNLNYFSHQVPYSLPFAVLFKEHLRSKKPFLEMKRRMLLAFLTLLLVAQCSLQAGEVWVWWALCV